MNINLPRRRLLYGIFENFTYLYEGAKLDLNLWTSSVENFAVFMDWCPMYTEGDARRPYLARSLLSQLLS